jgi:hypothetical protein
MLWGLRSGAVLVALVALGHFGGTAQAASTTKCKSPKETRAPVRGLKAGYATSCAGAKKVVLAWENRCEPNNGLCFFQSAGGRWGCTWVGLTSPTSTDVSLRCARKETTKGRPSVYFTEKGVRHGCGVPPNTRSDIRRVLSFYAVACGQATGVAAAWDAACTPGEQGSTCDFDSQGERWRCTQNGRPGIDFPFTYDCNGERTAKGRLALELFVQVGETPHEGGPPVP